MAYRSNRIERRKRARRRPNRPNRVRRGAATIVWRRSGALYQEKVCPLHGEEWGIVWGGGRAALHGVEAA
eukprot:11619550-Alexandrium_andersonii.AAC.1